MKLGKYFINETTLENNKEILRTEIVNFLRFSEKPEYIHLFERTFTLMKECLDIDKQQTIKIIAGYFNETSNTDMKWMTNVITQPDSSNFSERDKISYYFKIIDETLEGAFKPRFKLFSKLVYFKFNQSIIDNSGFDFGKLIRDFPVQSTSDASLFLKDPLFSISTNQWRNIAAHKSFTIGKNQIEVEYGRTTIQSLSISFEDFYRILSWTQNIYRVIRLAQVLIDLNYIKEIVDEIGGTERLDIRFESSLLHLIHMQIVGFEFVSTEEQGDTFCLLLKGKKGHDLKSSLIHASQCLDSLSSAIHDDKYIRDSFKNSKVCVIDEVSNQIGCATISIAIAIEKVYNKIDVEKYLDNMAFEVKNYA